MLLPLLRRGRRFPNFGHIPAWAGRIRETKYFSESGWVAEQQQERTREQLRGEAAIGSNESLIVIQ